MTSRSSLTFRKSIVPVLILTLLLTALVGLVSVRQSSATVVVISGDWTVTDTNVFEGIIFRVDGNVTVTSGAVLEIRNGGLTFLEDSNHIYWLDIQTDGEGHGSLILDNSVLTTEPNQLSDYLKLDIIVSGTLILRNDSMIKHPGTLTTFSEAVVEITESRVTGFNTGEIADFTIDPEDNNDAPIMTFGGSSTILFTDSDISRLFENPNDPGPDSRYNITLQDSAVLTIIDSYVGVDFHNSSFQHNVISAEGNSNVHIYNMTLDEAQSNTILPSGWLPALVPVGNGSTINIHRWLDAKVVDRFGSAIPGAYVESRILPTERLAYYPDNDGDINVPSSAVLDYLGRSASDFNVTDSTGRALIPLLTSWLNESVFDPTTPNSNFLGNYRIRASFSGQASSQDLSFNPYPALTVADNLNARTLDLQDLAWPAQDNTYTWSSPLIIDYDLELDGNLRITSNVTLAGANLAIIQGDIETGRHYLIIEGDGSLTIQDGGLSSNLPLVVHLRDDGRLNTSNSQLLLSTPEGRGLIYSEHSSVVEIEGGELEGDLMGLGSSFSLKGVSISSSSLTVDTGGTSYLWDLVFEDGMELALLSDDGDVTTLDFDIRNITFSEDLTSSMLFRGTQYVQLTNIVFLGVGDWWDGRVFDDAKASFYWWLTVNAVDGVGNTVSGANITVERLNPLTLAFDPIPSPGPDDLYYGIYTGSNFEAPQGAILYRALVQERLASQGWSNSTYKSSGSKVVDGQEYYAETEISVSMDDNTDVDLVFFNWPDLSVQVSDVSFSTAPVEGGSVDVQVTVHNLGKADALGAIIELYDDTTLVDSVTVDITLGTSELVTLSWVPQAAGTRTLRLWALSRNDTSSNTDLNMNNNFVSMEVQVLTRPDLELRPSEYGTLRVVEGRAFPVPVTVYNVGNTVASGFDVALYLNEVSSESLLAIQVGLLAPAAGNLSLSLDSPAVSEAGNHTLIVIADVSGVIPEIREDNNRVEFTLEVVPPEGKVFINLPQEGQSYSLGDQVFVSGSVNTPTGQPIPDMKVTVILRDTEGNFYDPKTVFTDQNGEYVVGLQLPAEAPSGEWVIMATAEAGTIESASLRLNVARVVPWYEFTVPMVNLPLWMLLVVLSIFLLVVFAITGYMKSVGLGRLAECGECGAFIPQSATSCPKCGIEFEKEMAKCSSCHAWIPLDVKKCPECGVEFTSGKTRTSDYRDRMRKQYEKVLEKYRDAATMALGRKPSEKEFQEWWRRQPTFLTFDDWLKEEEDMRKMGSKPCQICGALNSITASVCHKCGTLMSGNAPPTGETGKPPAPPPSPPAPQQESAGKPVLKKILKKPFTRRKKKGG